MIAGGGDSLNSRLSTSATYRSPASSRSGSSTTSARPASADQSVFVAADAPCDDVTVNNPIDASALAHFSPSQM